MFLRSLPLLILALAAAPAAAEEPLGAAQIVEAVTGARGGRALSESCSDKGKHLIWAVSLIISITRGGTSHFSTDLDLGRRPELKSDEKCEVPPLVIEVMRCEVTTFAKKVTHLSEHHSAHSPGVGFWATPELLEFMVLQIWITLLAF